jgi:ribosomal protein S14
VKEIVRAGASASVAPSRVCSLCGEAPAPVRLPFAVGRHDTPPQAREYRSFLFGRRRKKFTQRHRWVWYILWLCRRCGAESPSDRLWSVIQAHPGTRKLVDEGYFETRLGPEFDGEEGEVTFTEEPVA